MIAYRRSKIATTVAIVRGSVGRGEYSNLCTRVGVGLGLGVSAWLGGEWVGLGQDFVGNLGKFIVGKF